MLRWDCGGAKQGEGSRLKLPCSDQADAKGGEGARKKRPADSEGVRSSKAQKAEGSERGKREPIAFKPRDSGASGSGRSAENGQREASADLKRTGSQTEKRSVFERLHSGAGKVMPLSTAPQQHHVCKVDMPCLERNGSSSTLIVQDASTPRRAPPSREAASRALLITGFVRPFTEPMARQMLSETGKPILAHLSLGWIFRSRCVSPGPPFCSAAVLTCPVLRR